MTGPLHGDSVGDAYINVHADTSAVDGDLERGLAKAGDGAEPTADKVGKDLGGRIGDSVEKEVGKHGPSIAHTLGKEIEKEVVDVAPNFRYNVRGKDGRFVKKTAQGIADEVEEAFSRSTASGGIFSKIGQAINDAIGASFNISGKSPLIVGLIPVIGTIVGLVGALLQAINAVAATLTTIPALIAGIGLQAGVLLLAFHGIGEAVAGAFAAKNAKELNEALVNLAPSAKTFVKSLLPLKGIFDQLQYAAQQNFFKALGTSVTDVLNNIELPIRRAVVQLSTALGGAFKDILAAFAGPSFKTFLNTVIPATIQWVETFGPAFGTFLLGLIRLGTAATPLLSALGKLLNSGLTYLGDELTKLAKDPAFTKWLGSMLGTLKALGPLIQAAFGFIVTFLDTLNKAGGKELINTLTDVLNMLSKFLASEAGLRSINELIGIAIASIYTLAFVAEGILFLMASVQAFISWLINIAFPAIVDFLDWLGLGAQAIVEAIGRWFADLGVAIWHWVLDTRKRIVDFFEGLWTSINDGKGRLLLAVQKLPGEIKDALGDLGQLLLNAGKNVINGLINGIKSVIPNLRNVLSDITNLLPDWKGPEQKDRKILKPAGQAVMQGFGEGLAVGATDIKNMLGDFTDGLGVGLNANTTHILFGAGAVAVNFRGALPTQDQASTAGAAVGAGINSQLAARNTRLAVRTL